MRRFVSSEGKYFLMTVSGGVGLSNSTLTEVLLGIDAVYVLFCDVPALFSVLPPVPL